jgi:hypothetical protein
LKKPKHANYQECREKRPLANKFSFFFALLWKKETTKHALRSLLLGNMIWGTLQEKLIYFERRGKCKNSTKII